MDKLVETIDKQACDILSFLDNKMIRTSIMTFLAIYIAVWSPRLPENIAKLFQNNFFRLAVFTLALFVSTKDLGVSLMIALAFLVTMISIRKFNLMEMSQHIKEAVVEDENDVEADEEEPVEEISGYLSSADNQGMLEDTGSNEVNNEGMEDMEENVVGAALHPNGEHSGPQGLETVGGMEGVNMGSWANY
jgi:hypothetical protein